MTEYLQTTVDKFTFKVATDRLYSPEGLWIKAEGNRVRIGLSDYLQQRSGDMAFVEVKAAGAQVTRGEEIGTVETIKVSIRLAAPVSGTVVAVNPALAAAPEVINQDPFEAGWLVVVEAADLAVDRSHLLEAQAYFIKMKREAEQEVRK